MDIKIQEAGGFRYFESNPSGKPLLLLHGLFGAMSNFEHIIEDFGDTLNVVVPMLPIYDLPIEETGLVGLLRYVEQFIEWKGYQQFYLLGNSLGGHIAQLYILDHPERVEKLILTGSSGLFESGLGDGYPRRGDYEYIQRKTASTFYDPNMATKTLVDEVFETVNNRMKALRIVLTAKSALKHNLADKLHGITCPTLLVWGNQDTITPPFVGEKFNELIKGSTLVLLDQCGHAPMMEKPQEFNTYLAKFLT